MSGCTSTINGRSLAIRSRVALIDRIFNLCHDFRQPNGFNLRISFLLREIEVSVKFITPFSIVHSCVYGIQIIVYVAFIGLTVDWCVHDVMLFYECTSAIRVAANLILFTYMYCYSRSLKSSKIGALIEDSNQFDRHFQEFQRIIS